MPSDVMIYASDLSKRFGSFRAVDKINFEVRKGEVVGFLGPNGAGKSTTMRILTCFIAPTDGTARIKGHEVFEEPLEVRKSIGYLPQRAPLYLEMAVLEYLRFAGDLRGLDASTFKKRARNVVEICGLAQVLGKEIRHLSHGYRQRVGLAQALLHDPPILILDEPTSDLDPNEKAEFLDYLKQIGEDRTVLLSTHNLSEVETACARAMIVSKGRIVADGPLDEIRAKSGKVRYVVSIQESAGKQPYRGTGVFPKQTEVESALAALRGVGKVTELPTDDRAHAYELASDSDVDMRPELFKMVVDKGWVLLELHRDTQTLEDVFRQLTIGDERRNRQIGPVTESRAADEDEEDDEEEEEDEEESDDDDSDDEPEAKRGKR
jgi:ABC-2 type transport system ATP-binding protein